MDNLRDMFVEDIEGLTNLHDSVKKTELTTSDIMTFIKQLLVSLNYLHNKHPSFIIGNLSTESIFLTFDKQSKKTTAKIHIDEMEITMSKGNFVTYLYPISNFNLRFVHPLLLVEQHNYSYTASVDLWSLGCVVLDIATGGNLGHIKNGILVANYLTMPEFVVNMNEGSVPHVPEMESPAIKMFCYMCFQKDPKLQSSAIELFKHLERMSRIPGTKPQKQIYFLTTSDEKMVKCQLDNLLGTGGHGDLFEVTLMRYTIPKVNQYADGGDGNKKCALKLFYNHPSDIIFVKEIIKLDNPNILNYLAFGQCQMNNIIMPEEKDGILMEVVKNGTLSSLIKSHCQGLAEKDTVNYFRQIVSGLDYLHQYEPEPIIHGDLKGEKIFLKHGNIIKIGGLDKQFFRINKELKHYEKVDTSRAPSKETDIWSLGCILVEMATGKSFSDSVDLHVPEMSDMIKTLSEMCLHPNPKLRPTTTKIILEMKRISATNNLLEMLNTKLDTDASKMATCHFNDGQAITFLAVKHVNYPMGIPDNFEIFDGLRVKLSKCPVIFPRTTNQTNNVAKHLGKVEIEMSANLANALQYNAASNGKSIIGEITYSEGLVKELLRIYPYGKQTIWLHWLNLCNLRHKNICRYFAVGGIDKFESILQKQERTLNVLMEDTQGLSLRDYAMENRLSTEQVFSFTKQLLDALQNMHHNPFWPHLVLYNLSSHTIYIRPDEKSAKIHFIDAVISFFMSEYWHYTDFLLPYFISAISNYDKHFIHPSLLDTLDKRKLMPYSFDIWSLGCVVLDMVTGGNLRHVDKNGDLLPPDLDNKAFVDAMKNGGHAEIDVTKWLLPEKETAAIEKLCQICFERDPEEQESAWGLLIELQRMMKTKDTTKPTRRSCTLTHDDANENNVFLGEMSYLVDESDEFKFGINVVTLPQSSIAKVKRFAKENNKFAMKIFRYCNNESRKMKRMALCQLEDKNIVNCVASGTCKAHVTPLKQLKRCWILMEFIEGGTLSEYLVKEKVLAEKETINYFQQITSGLEYLHRDKPNLKSIVHGHLRGDHILLTADRKTVKIGALEYCFLLNDSNDTSSVAKQCTIGERSRWYRHRSDILRYISPEIIKKERTIGIKTDIWSLGCVLLEMVTGGNLRHVDKKGTLLDKDISNSAFEKVIEDGGFPQVPEMEPQLKMLCGMCLQSDPEMRTTAAQLLEHLQFPDIKPKRRLALKTNVEADRITNDDENERIYQTDKKKLHFDTI